MAHFYGTVQGNRGEGTRLGTTKSGITTHAAGWGGAIRTEVFYDAKTGRDMYRVELIPWQGSGGVSRVLAEGELNARIEQETPRKLSNSRPTPWSVFETDTGKVQIRDAKDDILFVSSSYGEHSGAPLTRTERKELAALVVASVNECSGAKP